jgi:hypothetical protein
MSRTPYAYYKENGSRYKFISSGKRAIEKVVEFTPTTLKNVYNLGFGDLLPTEKWMIQLIQTMAISLSFRNGN